MLDFALLSHLTLQGITKAGSAPFLLHLPLESFMCTGSPIDLAGEMRSQLRTPPLKSYSLFFIGIGEGGGAVLRPDCNAQMIS